MRRASSRSQDANAATGGRRSEGSPWTQAAALERGVTVTGLACDIVRVPVIGNGGLRDPDLAARVIAEGEADLVSLGRGALANPDRPERVRSGARLEAFDRAMLSPLAELATAHTWRVRAGAAGV